MVLPSRSFSTGSFSWPLMSFRSGLSASREQAKGFAFAVDDLLEVVPRVAQRALCAPARVRPGATVIDVADVQSQLVGHVHTIWEKRIRRPTGMVGWSGCG